MSVKISACLIVRDSAATLDTCLASIRAYVEEIVIVDTGSVDDTPAIARKYADKFEVFLDCNDAESGLIEDFSLARNRSFALATNDVVFWCDSDDVVQGADQLPRLAAELVKHENGQVLFPYEYQHDAAGRCTILHYRERLLYPRRAWEWRFPVHEGCLLAAGNEVKHTETSDAVRVIHKHVGERSEPGRNLRILQKYCGRVGEDDIRSLYYLGVELGLAAGQALALGRTPAFINQTGQSIRVLRRYIELSPNDDERCLAMIAVAKHLQRLNLLDDAIEWALRATRVKPWAEPYYLIMDSYCALGQQEPRNERAHYARGAHFGHLGNQINPENKVQSLWDQNAALRFRAQSTLSYCLARTGFLDEAIKVIEHGLSGMPEDKLMQENLAAYRVEQSKRSFAGELAKLETAGVVGGAAATIIKGALNGDFEVRLLETPIDMPDSAAGGAVLADGERARAPRGAHVDSRPARDPGKLDIIFYVGEGYEPWNGETIARTGLGGSETMAWELARRLAGRGHSVRLVGHCGPDAQPGTYQGVVFEDFRSFFGPGSGDRRCDVLISSRRPEVVDDAAGIEAGCRILWVHDVHCGEALNHRRNLRFDRIFALSNWHKSFLRRCYPLVDPGKIVVTRNGVDLERFADRVHRNARRAIYSSSPDRGLAMLLDIWPVVRKSIPDAELHVFYGFENWERGADENELKKIQHLKARLGRTAGVRVRGRVNGLELAREQLMSGVWAYPTNFTETSCITAMEAQAAGCRIVTSPLAALNETVGQRGQLVAGYGTPGYVETFASAVVMAMTETLGARAADDRAHLQAYARDSFGLDKLAEEWESLLTETLADVQRRVVPEFHKACVG
jgi:glycosyltransferase involved in cell wall biosynthesis/tetratricopeptide (TPR) repeat protein